MREGLRAMAFETGRSPGELLDGSVLAHVIEGAPVGFGMHDAAGMVTYVNQYLTELLGYEDPSELIGRDVRTFIAEEDRAEYQKRLESRPSEHGDPYSVGVVRKDMSGMRILVRPVPILDGEGEIVAEAAFILDTESAEASGRERATDGLQPSRLEELTAREREVFEELVEGKSVRDIAEGRFISEHTVRNHIKAIYRKLGLHSRIELMRSVLHK